MQKKSHHRLVVVQAVVGLVVQRKPRAGEVVKGHRRVQVLCSGGKGLSKNQFNTLESSN